MRVTHESVACWIFHCETRRLDDDRKDGPGVGALSQHVMSRGFLDEVPKIDFFLQLLSQSNGLISANMGRDSKVVRKYHDILVLKHSQKDWALS